MKIKSYGSLVHINHLVVSTAVLTAISIFFIVRSGRNFADSVVTTIPYNPKPKKWKLRSQNPPAPRLSSVSDDKQIYVAIIDDEYQPKPHHCKMANQWVSEFLENPRVDGVEIYSANAWSHPDCNLSTITIPSMPPQLFNPSAYILLRTFKMFLQRSTSGYLFVIGDAAYIKTNQFFQYLDRVTTSTRPLSERFMIGCCVEQRYFFQMLMINSGIVFSRRLVEDYVNSSQDHLWNVSFDVGIASDEILAQISDKIGIHIPGKQTHYHLGRGWRVQKHYQYLKDKKFDELPQCNIPMEYLRPPPGELGLCAAQIYKVNEVFVWSGSRGMTKLQFLESAEEWLTDIPDNVAYYWDRLYPTLCLR